MFGTLGIKFIDIRALFMDIIAIFMDIFAMFMDIIPKFYGYNSYALWI
jgi:hypothetical protein